MASPRAFVDPMTFEQAQSVLELAYANNPGINYWMFYQDTQNADLVHFHAIDEKHNEDLRFHHSLFKKDLLPDIESDPLYPSLNQLQQPDVDKLLTEMNESRKLAELNSIAIERMSGANDFRNSFRDSFRSSEYAPNLYPPQLMNPGRDALADHIASLKVSNGFLDPSHKAAYQPNLFPPYKIKSEEDYVLQAQINRLSGRDGTLGFSKPK